MILLTMLSAAAGECDDDCDCGPECDPETCC